MLKRYLVVGRLFLCIFSRLFYSERGLLVPLFLLSFNSFASVGWWVVSRRRISILVELVSRDVVWWCFREWGVDIFSF